MAEQECHEEVSRRGEVQPCNKVAVAMRFDPTFGDPYPVCAFHARGSNMMSLSAVEAAVRADMQREVRTVEAPVAPWDRLDGCFGHCDPEGWYAPCALTPSTPNQQGAEQK